MRHDLPPAVSAVRPKPSGQVGIAVLLGTIAVLYLAREILIPFAFALTLTFLLTPVVAQLQRLRVGRVVSVLAAVLVSLATACGIGWIIANQLVDVANQLPQYRENIQAKIKSLHVPVTGHLGAATATVQEIAQELTGAGVVAPQPPSPDTPPSSPSPISPSPQGAAHKAGPPPAGPAAPIPVRMVPTPDSGWANLLDLGTPVLALLGRTGMVLIFTFFMLLNREDLRNRFLRLAGVGQLNLMTQALDDAAGRVSRYLLMQFVVDAGFGALFGLGLYLIGLPYPVLWGAVAGLLRIVPYAGIVVAGVFPLALSLAVFDGWLQPSLVFLLAAGLELITGNFFEPWLYGAYVGISSLALLVTTVFWTVLWGPAGLILSTPLTVCAVVLGRYVPQLSFLHILLGDEPALTAEAQIYQRLLAMDQAEAQAIANDFLKDRSLIELYDLVLIPALAMAEQDRHKGAIDTSREEFLFLSLNEMLGEFAESHFAESPAPDQDQEGASTSSAAASRATAPDPAPRSDSRIFCVPAHDRADEITAAMLAQFLEHKGLAVLSFSIAAPSPNEWMSLLEPSHNDVVCISSLPPYAFSPARAMCKQIRERFPKLKVVVCVWGFAGDTDQAKARFERTPPDRLVTTLAAAVEQVQELAAPEAAPSQPGAPPQASTVLA
jgi:predicted PurR-regulated permease PerM